PSFPVLPGVMRLDAITEAAGWLQDRRRPFARALVLLKVARHVKYGSFVAPGNSLRLAIDFLKDTAAGASFKASGTVGQSSALQARVELAYFNLGDRNPALAELDGKILEHTR